MAGERDPLIGQEIDGYFIEQLIGQGGMARVYQGRDVRLGRSVVIKVIKPTARANDDYRERFEVEAQAIAQLMHPRIVQIYRFGEVGTLYYMAMQYIDGVDLSSLLKDYAESDQLLPHADVLRIISQVGAALDYAHYKGIIHRDVKPANIMLDTQGNATLTDFGLAHLQEKGTHGEIFGTPYYVAPEQAMSSSHALPQSDLYALGIVLYEMLTGSLPFVGNTAVEIAEMHLTEQPPSALELNPDLHPAFLPILERALQKEPSDRYQSGDELAADLADAVAEASRDPDFAEKQNLRLSPVGAAEKVFEMLDRRFHTEDFTPVNLSLNNLTLPTVGVSLYDSSEYYDRGGSQERRLSVASIIAILLGIGVVVVLLLALFGGQPGEPNPPAVVQAGADGNTTLAEATTEATDRQANFVTPEATFTETEFAPTTAPATPEVTAEPPPAQANTAAVALRFVTNGDDSLYVVNISPLPLNLAPLELRGAQSNAVSGTVWGVATLNNQECVRVLRDENAFSPNITCSVVGNLITQNDPERFWLPDFQSFEVYYDGALVGTCPTAGCVLPIPVPGT